jgi:hypothetical protein
LPERAKPTTVPANTSDWPANVEDLPIFLTQKQLAELLACSERKLERHRCSGEGIPFVKHGRRVYYPRDVVLAELRKRLYSSTTEAKRAERELRLSSANDN